MGLRLPLDSIPWVADKEYPWNWPQDPSNPNLPQLPTIAEAGVPGYDVTGWYGPGDDGVPMSRKQAPFWVYGSGPLTLRLAGDAPLEVRVAVDDREGAVVLRTFRISVNPVNRSEPAGLIVL